MRWSQPLAVVKSTFDFMRQFSHHSVAATLRGRAVYPAASQLSSVLASGGSAPSR